MDGGEQEGAAAVHAVDHARGTHREVLPQVADHDVGPRDAGHWRHADVHEAALALDDQTPQDREPEIRLPEDGEAGLSELLLLCRQLPEEVPNERLFLRVDNGRA